jgi:lipoprotein NlpI
MHSLRSPIRIARLVLVLGLGLAPALRAAVPAEASSPAQLASQASASLAQRDFTNAIALATAALASDPKNLRALAVRGRAHSLLRNPTQAIPDFTAALAADPASPDLYQARGEDYFRLGRFRESVADFDRCLELVPQQKPYHWQRGISCYYAGQFEEGRKQFELHQTVNAHDVENAVWHFLCVARLSGMKKARAALIPIDGDTRVPMSQVHQLFAGKITPEEVLSAARSARATPAQAAKNLAYAHLYLGLYFEASGDAPAAREHIFKAAADFEARDYMGDVARSHANVLRGKATK